MRHRKTEFLLSFAFLLLSLGLYAQRTQQTVSLSDKYNTFRDYSTINFQPVFESINNKRIVAIGESSHGVQDLHFFINLLTRELMEEGLAKTIIIEKPFASIWKVNRYVHGEEYDFKELMNSVGLTMPARDLIQWMRDYNAQVGPAGSVSIFGMDINGNNSRDAVDFLNDFLARHSSPFQVGRDSLLKNASHKKDTLVPNYITFVENVLKEVQNSKNGISPDTAQLVRAMVENLQMSIGFDRASPFTFTKIRDEFLFQNVEFIEEQLVSPNSSIVLWAHNGHIRKGGASFIFKPVGHLLHQRYGSKYMTIGQDFIRGRAFAMQEVTVTEKDNADKSFLGSFVANSKGVSFINLRQDFKLTAATDLQIPKKFKLHDYGIKKGMQKYQADEFDAIVLLDEVTSIYDVDNWEAYRP